MSTAAQPLSEQQLVLDRYRPLRPLGRGGSGSVWLARDERTGLEVALKIVPREGKRASRAAREIEAASRLRHERCVRSYDFGGDAGHVYIAYEYVQGVTLRDALRAGLVTDADAIEAAAQILDALAHAHRHGIVHRDVKPSNVLVEDGPRISVRLLDFGLAQFDDADTLTAVGDVPGTLAYIAPERLRGQDATAESDVWAVGVILWEALTGEHPFWGVPLPQVAAAIESGAPPLQSKRPDLSPAVVRAVASALATDPRRRPGAGELAQSLRELDAARPRRSPKRAVAPKQAAGERRLTLPAVRLERQLVPAALAALTAAGGALLLPFWPPGLVLALAAAAALATVRSPRLGLAIALFAPVFPLGNATRAGAILYAALAASWLALSWRDARHGLLFVAGPLLATVGGLALLPLAVQPARGAARRFAQAVVGTLAAAGVVAVRGGPLPLTGEPVTGVELGGSESVTEVSRAIVSVLQAQPALVSTSLALGLVSVLLPLACRRGLWAIAALGAGQIAVALLAAPGMPALSFVLGTWLLCAALAGVTLARGR